MPAMPPLSDTDRILVVGGHSQEMPQLIDRLRGLGYEVPDQATRAADAISTAEGAPPQLVICDSAISDETDGLNLATSLRQHLSCPVVVVAHDHNLSQVQHASNHPIMGYLTPGFDDRELHLVLSSLISKHRTELRMLTAEARYRALTTSTLEGIVTTSITGRITSWNRGAEIIFGYKEEEILRQPLTALLPSRYRRENLRVMARLRTSGGDAEAEHRVELLGRHKDGREFPLDLALTPWSSPEGRFVTGIIRDISERKKSEERLRLQSAALRAASNTVVITDTGGRIEWVNPAFETTTGYTKGEILGKNPRLLNSGQQPRTHFEEMWRKIQGGENWRGEFINRHKDGHLFIEDVSITPVRNENDEITHFVAIKQDISALKQNIHDLETAHQELAQKNRALDVALIEARAASEAKAAFLATMSHEIRTPMNGFIGMASLLRNSSPLTEEQVDYIDTICSSGETLLTLINDILDFSKIESNHMDLESVPFNLRHCLEETLDNVAPPAREKNLDLALEIDASVPDAIVGDSVRIRQVISNLVGNAIKFTAEGEVVVQVRAEPPSGDRQCIHFLVKDTGIGVPPEKLDRLFKSFSQVDSSTTRVYGGTGLGLAISQRLIGLMGGEIKVTSEEGKGSTFYFDLDLPVSTELVTATEAFVPPDLAGLTILIVDDNATNRRIFSTQLKQANCRSFECAGAPEALKWLAENPLPDLILTDMLMPQMDGLNFTRKFRMFEKSLDTISPTPVVMISSGGFQAKDPGVEAANFAFCLTKPVHQHQLIETVGRACSVKLAKRASRRTEPAGESLASTAINHPRRILLAEDNPVNRKVATAMLRRLGYTIDVATNGVEATAACKKSVYDLVLMDVLMPEMDGLEATRQIRRRDDHQPLIVAMTANAMEGDRQTCLDSGMDDYVTKPIKIETLQYVVGLPLRQPPA